MRNARFVGILVRVGVEVFRVSVAALGAAVALACAGQASATIIVGTYQGDTNGFGADAASPFGLLWDPDGSRSIGWTATFFYDAAIGYAFTDFNLPPPDFATVESSTGGLFATFSIGAGSLNILGAGGATRWHFSPDITHVVQAENYQQDANALLDLEIYQPGSSVSVPNLDQPGSVQGQSDCWSSLQSAHAGGTLCPYSATFRVATADDLVLIKSLGFAVPEPSAWALMIFGLGAVGGTLRSRRPAVFTR